RPTTRNGTWPRSETTRRPSSPSTDAWVGSASHRRRCVVAPTAPYPRRPVCSRSCARPTASACSSHSISRRRRSWCRSEVVTRRSHSRPTTRATASLSLSLASSSDPTKGSSSRRGDELGGHEYRGVAGADRNAAAHALSGQQIEAIAVGQTDVGREVSRIDRDVQLLVSRARRREGSGRRAPRPVDLPFVVDHYIFERAPRKPGPFAARVDELAVRG